MLETCAFARNIDEYEALLTLLLVQCGPYGFSQDTLIAGDFYCTEVTPILLYCLYNKIQRVARCSQRVMTPTPVVDLLLSLAERYVTREL